ncbi:MAG: murein biosynthesis integral membrane protein MurJ [Desulfobacteraceae bacterium]|nr:murein biosynthesis integral membrane protein MurJ [Desulfobacteraceae bacterium]
MTTSSTIKKVSFASLIMMTSVFLSRVIGLFREMSIAYVGGVKADVDAYQIAFIIPEILNHVVASGFLSITFIPIFSSYLTKGEEEKGWEIFNIILNTFGLILLAFIGITMVFAPVFVRLLAFGIEDPLTFALSVKMTRIIIPAQFFVFTGGLFMAVQFAKEKFFIPAFSGLIYNAGIIFGGLVLGRFLGIEGFAWGVLGGAFVGFLFLQYLGARRLGMRYKFLFKLNHPDFKKYVILTLPLILGFTMIFSTEILVKFFGSFQEEGSIAAMNYAFRIMFILAGFFGQAVGVASYPFLAKLASKGDMEGMNQLLNNTIKFLFIVIPFSILFIVLRQEIVLILYQRGQFNPHATLMTSNLLIYFMIGAVAFSCQTVVVRGFYAMQNTLFPAIYSTITVIVFLPVIYYLIKAMGTCGIALGISFMALFQTITLFEIWNKRSNNTSKKDVYRFFQKILLLSLVIGGILYFAAKGVKTIIDPTSLYGALLTAMIVGILFLILLIGGGMVFKIEEIQIILKKSSDRILPWKKK